MSRRADLETTLEWWDEDELPKLRAVALEIPPAPDAQTSLEASERARELAYKRAAEAWEREQDEEYAAQWASWAYGPDVNA